MCLNFLIRRDSLTHFVGIVTLTPGDGFLITSTFAFLGIRSVVRSASDFVRSRACCARSSFCPFLTFAMSMLDAISALVGAWLAASCLKQLCRALVIWYLNLPELRQGLQSG